MVVGSSTFPHHSKQVGSITMSPQPPAAGPSVENKVEKDKKDKKAKKEKKGTKENKEQSTSSTQPPTVSTPAFSSLFGGSVDPNLDSVFAQSVRNGVSR